jgi:alanine dehydrogenase
MIVLARSETAALASLPGCIEAVRQAFFAYGSGGALGLARVHIPGVGGGVFHLAAGGVDLGERGAAVCVKLNGRFPLSSGLPGERVQGAILVADATDGTPIALLDSAVVTTLRTAAVTAVVFDHLASPNAVSALVIGAGRQGKGQVDALAQDGRIGQLRLFDVDRAAADRLAGYARDLGLDAQSEADVHAAARASDVIVTVTPARAPIVDAADVSPGTLVVALGADAPGKQELDPALLAGARVVVDVLAQAAESGELQHPLARGLMTRDQVHAELGEVVAGTRPGRTEADEIFVFDGTGTALQDLAAATLLIGEARRRGVGLEFELDA